jgi:hypothetical protein
MAEVIMYLIESSVLLALFYFVYWLALRKETLFTVSRFFLIGALVSSILLPLISLDLIKPTYGPIERPIEAINNFRISYYDAIAGWEFDASRGREALVDSEPIGMTSVSGSFEIIMLIILIVYSIGVVVILSRNVWTIRWIQSLISCSSIISRDGIKIIRIPQPIAPFSFFRYVFVYDAMVDTPEFNQILAHEKTHIEQRHSIDLVFVQILAAFLWFNPVVWQLIKSLKTTHEYIADRRIINSGYSLVEYQTLLLKQLISNNSFGLVHNFNLSFIKKRITMMKNRRSGWPGKAKVALAIAGTLIISAAIVQCNTKLDEDPMQSGNTSGDDVIKSISLPVLPKTGYHFDGDHSDALTLVIADNKLTIDGQSYKADEIASVIESKGIPSLTGHVVMLVDKNQKMGLVRGVEMALREADKRKILYVGVGTDGSKVETPIMLPPTLEEARRLGVFVESDIAKAEADGMTAILKFKAGENDGNSNQQKVYNFVKDHLNKSSTDYVVSLKYDDNDTYGSFLTNLHFIREGYIQIYQERSKALFGKDYYDISKEEYKMVRMNAPMAISIAEK